MSSTNDKYCPFLEIKVNTFNASTHEISEFEVSLVYRGSSRTARATQRNCLKKPNMCVYIYVIFYYIILYIILYIIVVDLGSHLHIKFGHCSDKCNDKEFTYLKTGLCKMCPWC